MTFEREDRYIVIKKSDLRFAESRLLQSLIEQCKIKTRQGLVIESDWPEYELAWKMIEDRVSK